MVRHSGSPGSDTAQDPPLANPDRLWPSGGVKYKFYHTVPVENRKIVQEAMTKSTTKVSEDCIRFQEATDSTEDYILILDGVNVCNRELERTGGEQVIKSIK